MISYLFIIFLYVFFIVFIICIFSYLFIIRIIHILKQTHISFSFHNVITGYVNAWINYLCGAWCQVNIRDQTIMLKDCLILTRTLGEVF